MIKFRWFDPTGGIATMALTGISAIGSAVGSASQGSAQAGAYRTQAGLANSQADLYTAQIGQTKLEEARALTDLTNERNSTISSARASFAAQGGDIDEGVIAGIAGKAGDQEQRIHDDAQFKEKLLYQRAMGARSQASNLESQASGAETGGLIKGLGSLIGGAASIAGNGFWSTGTLTPTITKTGAKALSVN